MITLEFDEIFSIFHNKVEAYDFLELDEDDVYELECEWLRMAGVQPYLRRIFSTYVYNDDEEVIECELNYPVDDDYDTYFVTEILAIGVAVMWLTPKVASLENIYQTYGSKEEKFYSEAQHLKEIKALRNSLQLEQRKLIRDRGASFNSYLEGYGD